MKTKKNVIWVVILLSIFFSVFFYKNTVNQKVNIHDNLLSETNRNLQYYQISTEKDTVIVADNGTRIVFPKGCFVNKRNKIIEGEIEFVIKESFDKVDMLLSNLTTSLGNQLLKSDGMIYIDALYNGHRVFINKKNPIYFQVPTDSYDPTMMKYKGVIEKDGSINWIEPQKFNNFLVNVKFELLDFLPPQFENELREYYDHFVPKGDIDSIYYGLKLEKIISEIRGVQVIQACDKGINPRIIQTIKSPEFQETFFATHEFESRMPYIYKTRNDKVLQLYMDNIDKNMWEIDQMVAAINDSLPISRVRQMIRIKNNENINFYEVDTVGYKNVYTVFNEFAQKKHTNVSNNIYANALKKYFEKVLKQNQKNFEILQKKIKRIKLLNQKEIRELELEYGKLLLEQRKYRMETYGFVQTELGWVNIDVGVVPKNWDYTSIDVTIDNTNQENTIQVFVVYSTINSILRLKSLDGTHFKIDDVFKEQLPIYKDEKLLVLAMKTRQNKSLFGYQWVDLKEQDVSEGLRFSLHLNSFSNTQIKDKLIDLIGDESAKSIQIEFELAQKLKTKKDKFLKEEQFIQRLKNIAFQCF